jgi:hypothetical protein
MAPFLSGFGRFGTAEDLGDEKNSLFIVFVVAQIAQL